MWSPICEMWKNGAVENEDYLSRYDMKNAYALSVCKNMSKEHYVSKAGEVVISFVLSEQKVNVFSCDSKSKAKSMFNNIDLVLAKNGLRSDISVYRSKENIIMINNNL